MLGLGGRVNSRSRGQAFCNPPRPGEAPPPTSGGGKPWRSPDRAWEIPTGGGESPTKGEVPPEANCPPSELSPGDNSGREFAVRRALWGLFHTTLEVAP